MKKKILRLFIVIFVISSIIISPAKAEAATEIKQINITLNVGTEKSLDTYIVSNKYFYGPVGKFTISDPSIVGLDCKYDKKRDEWTNHIVGLRPGKTTLLRWQDKNKYIKFNITVNRVEIDSITSFFGMVKTLRSSGLGLHEPEKSDKAIIEMLKDLHLEQYNSDRERINVISKYLYKNVTLLLEDRLDTYLDNTVYSALVEKVTCSGVNPASGWALQVLGFDIRQAELLEIPWYRIRLEGIEYRYDLLDAINTGYLIGSEAYNTQYVGEGTYTNEAGKTFQGSLYYDDIGDISNTLADTFTLDVYNGILTTNFNKYILPDDECFYTSTNRKTHLPAWLIGNDTPQQLMLKGEKIALPEDRLSSNVFSSDETIVKIDDNKIIGVKEGIAIVYRYDDTYCDAFYVVVDSEKVNYKKLKVDYKPDGKKYSTYKPSDICINRRILNEDVLIWDKIWTGLPLYKLETAFNGGKIQTSFKDGYMKVYVIDSNGNKQQVFDDTDYLLP